MTNKDRSILLFTLLLISAIIATDIINDSLGGVVWWHLLTEGAAGLLAIGGVLYLLSDMIKLRQDLNLAHDREINLKQEADQWRNKSKAYLEGLSTLIDSQLSVWSLTAAEREVAFLLLKGLSLKDVAILRGTSEKTARVQSTAIYSKAGLGSRSELSAFFLEDLLPPQIQ